MAIPKIEELLDLTHTLAAPLFDCKRYPWEILPLLKEFIRALGASLSREEYDEIAPEVWVHKTAKIAPTALIAGPTVIGAGTEVRHCAFIRGSALVGENCVVGNSTEVKNAVIFDNVQVPHYNYVGYSILGFRSHMGAGVVASNFRSDKGNVGVRDGDQKIETGMRKLGAILGDGVDVGCNSVLCPGSVVGRDAIIYPLSRVRGFVPERSILKGDGSIVPRKL